MSKVLCVSPAGHEALEDSMAPCCVPMRAPAVAFSEPAPCDGCTDYPVNPILEMVSARPDLPNPADIGGSAPLPAVPVRIELAGAGKSAPPLDARSDLANLLPGSTSLRC